MKVSIKLVLLIAALGASCSLSAQTGAFNGLCTLGGKPAVTSGLSSSNYPLVIIPGCTVRVVLTGTNTLARIFKDSLGTPLTNPFTATTIQATQTGQWLFYAATGQGYDVVMSGGIAPNTFPTPVTLTDLIVPAGGSGTGCTVTGSAGSIVMTNGSGGCTVAPADYNLSEANSFDFHPGDNFNVVLHGGASNNFNVTNAGNDNFTPTLAFNVTASGGINLTNLVGSNTQVNISQNSTTTPLQITSASDRNDSVAGVYNLSADDMNTSATGHYTLVSGDITPGNNLCIDGSNNVTTSGCTGGGGGVTSINTVSGAYTFSFSSGAGNCTGTICTFTGSGAGGGSVTNFIASAVSWPTWLVPSVATSTTTPTLSVTANAIPNASLAIQTANTVLGALTATTPSGLTMPSCSTGTSALTWTTSTGFGCNSITGGGDTITSPGATISVGGTSTNTTLDIALTHANTWSALTTFSAGINLSGASSPLQVGGSAGTATNCLLSAGTGATPTWGACPGSGSTAFNTITSGTNSAAAMVITSGASLNFSGSGTINASSVGGVALSGLCQTGGAGCPASGSSSWSSLTNPSSNLALTMASHATSFTFGATTGASDLMLWTDTASNTGTGILGHFTTAASSTETPWQADSNGVGWKVGTDGSFTGVGSSTSHGFIIPGGTALTPVAVSGGISTDSSGNLESSDAGGAFARVCNATNGVCGGGTGALVASAEVVSFSATPTFSVAKNVSRIVLTGNITSFTLGAGADGQDKTLCFEQDGTGSRTVAPPGNVHGFFTVGSTLSTWSCQTFAYDLTDSIWLATSPGVVTQ